MSREAGNALTILAVLACQVGVTAAALVAIRHLGVQSGLLPVTLGAILIVSGTVLVKFVLGAVDDWIDRAHRPAVPHRRVRP